MNFPTGAKADFLKKIHMTVVASFYTNPENAIALLFALHHQEKCLMSGGFR